MSNELQRRLASIEKKIFASPAPCPKHFPSIICCEECESDERANALPEAMSECPRCGPAKLRGGPRLLVIGMPKGFVDPLGSKPVTARPCRSTSIAAYPAMTAKRALTIGPKSFSSVARRDY